MDVGALANAPANRIVHVCGNMGTGKSTLVAALARATGWPVASPDRIGARLAWKVQAATLWDLDTDARATALVARNLVRSLTWTMMRRRIVATLTRPGPPLIVDSTGWNPAEAVVWADVPEHAIVRVMLTARLAVAWRRVRARMMNPDWLAQRPATLLWSEQETAAVLLWIQRRARGGPPPLPGRVALVLDTSALTPQETFAAATVALGLPDGSAGESL
jgi:predicted kinase